MSNSTITEDVRKKIEWRVRKKVPLDREMADQGMLFYTNCDVSCEDKKASYQWLLKSLERMGIPYKGEGMPAYTDDITPVLPGCFPLYVDARRLKDVTNAYRFAIDPGKGYFCYSVFPTNRNSERYRRYEEIVKILQTRGAIYRSQRIRIPGHFFDTAIGLYLDLDVLHSDLEKELHALKIEPKQASRATQSR